MLRDPPPPSLTTYQRQKTPPSQCPLLLGGWEVTAVSEAAFGGDSPACQPHPRPYSVLLPLQNEGIHPNTGHLLTPWAPSKDLPLRAANLRPVMAAGSTSSQRQLAPCPGATGSANFSPSTVRTGEASDSLLPSPWINKPSSRFRLFSPPLASNLLHLRLNTSITWGALKHLDA